MFGFNNQIQHPYRIFHDDQTIRRRIDVPDHIHSPTQLNELTYRIRDSLAQEGVQWDRLEVSCDTIRLTVYNEYPVQVQPKMLDQVVGY